MKKLLIILSLCTIMLHSATARTTFRSRATVKVVSDTSAVNKAQGRLYYYTADNGLYVADGTYLKWIWWITRY